MNWYKKAQVELDYRPQDSYTDFAHSGAPVFLWWWDQGKLYVEEMDRANSYKTHGDAMGREENLRFPGYTWQGRYEPESDNLTMIPRRRSVPREPPRRLLDALYKQFGVVKIKRFI
tara:strand:- start:12553 stop:12900 length:348 start_codon:yes stop_codon:yes gene_type:complete